MHMRLCESSHFGMIYLPSAPQPELPSNSRLLGFGEGFSHYVHPLLLGKHDVEGGEIVQ